MWIFEYLSSVEGVKPTTVEEIRGRHRITTTNQRSPSSERVEEIRGRHRITTGARLSRSATQWKRLEEDIESQRQHQHPQRLREWKRLEEDIESQSTGRKSARPAKWKRLEEDIESQLAVLRLVLGLQWKRLEEYIESQRVAGERHVHEEWKRSEEDIESQLARRPAVDRLSGRDQRKTSNHNTALDYPAYTQVEEIRGKHRIHLFPPGASPPGVLCVRLSRNNDRREPTRLPARCQTKACLIPGAGISR